MTPTISDKSGGTNRQASGEPVKEESRVVCGYLGNLRPGIAREAAEIRRGPKSLHKKLRESEGAPRLSCEEEKKARGD